MENKKDFDPQVEPEYKPVPERNCSHCGKPITGDYAVYKGLLYCMTKPARCIDQINSPRNNPFYLETKGQ